MERNRLIREEEREREHEHEKEREQESDLQENQCNAELAVTKHFEESLRRARAKEQVRILHII